MEAAALMSSLLRSHTPHCSHHDGHVVASTVCGRHECSLANYGLLVNTTRDACGSGAFHGVVTATLIHTLVHRRLVNSGSLPDLRSRDPQLWAVLSRVSYTLCSDAAVLAWLGPQLGECGHGLGHAFHHFATGGHDYGDRLAPGASWAPPASLASSVTSSSKSKYAMSSLPPLTAEGNGTNASRSRLRSCGAIGS